VAELRAITEVTTTTLGQQRRAERTQQILCRVAEEEEGFEGARNALTINLSAANLGTVL
jgi:hypothetical protein